jgi:integrase
MPTFRKRGKKWQVQIRRRGQASLTKSFLLKEDAMSWARHMEVQADRKALPENTKLLDEYTLRSLVERYRDNISIRKRGCDVERIVLNAFLRHPICQIRLSELTSSDFAIYRDHRLKTVKPNSLRREFSTLHHIFTVARNEWGLPLTVNPLDHIQIPTDYQRRERRLREGELEKLINAARPCRNPYVIPIIHLAVETGMRRGEIISMCWEHLDLEKRSLLIPHTKNGYARTIPLTADALGVLKGLRERKGISHGCGPSSLPIGDTSVFPITANAFRLAWQRVKRRAGIDDLHFHDLRHEAISRFFEMGLNAPEVALISGHRDMRMLFRYTHPMRSRVLEKLDAHHRVPPTNT